MNYEISVSSECITANAVKGRSPLNIDSFHVIQAILLVGVAETLTCHEVVAAI